MSMVEASTPRVMIDKAFSVPKCVQLARTSHQSHLLLRRMLGAVPGTGMEDLSETWVEELFSLEKENSSDFEKQSTGGKTLSNAQSVDENDLTHDGIGTNLRSINPHGDHPITDA